MSDQENPDQQYTTDGERENPEQLTPPVDPPDSDDDKDVPEGTGGARTKGGAGMVQTE
jgi:hypothetical protein